MYFVDYDASFLAKDNIGPCSPTSVHTSHQSTNKLISTLSARVYQVFTIAYVSSMTSVVATQWRSWLRHCATSRNVADSISDYVIGIFH